MRVRAVLAIALGMGVLTAAGCRHRDGDRAAQSGDPSLGYGLGNGDPDKRKDAAEDLRKDDGPPPGAVPFLIQALARETDRDAKEEMLITLGASGSPDAKPVLEAHLNDADKQGRKGAEKGLERWSKKTGQSTSGLATIAKLGSPDPDVRRDAAEDLGDHGGPPAEAIAPLVAAASKEQNRKALEKMLLTLGASGAPEAKPVIEQHVDDSDSDIRRPARRAMKIWQTKNGQNVRRDVEAAVAAMPIAATTASAAAAPPPPPDGCGQFKDICAADPFAVDKCRADMKPLAITQQQVWADCVNESQLACQKASDACMLKAKKAK